MAKSSYIHKHQNPNSTFHECLNKQENQKEEEEEEIISHMGIAENWKVDSEAEEDGQRPSSKLNSLPICQSLNTIPLALAFVL